MSLVGDSFSPQNRTYKHVPLVGGSIGQIRSGTELAVQVLLLLIKLYLVRHSDADT